MERRYGTDVEYTGDAVTISNRCNMKMVQTVYAKLDKTHKAKLRKSCFSQLLKLKNIKLASQIVHQLIVRSAKNSQKEEAWFIVGNKPIRFGIQEFVLVTGLNAGGVEDVDKTLGIESPLMEKYFSMEGETVTKADVYDVFETCDDNGDRYKLGLILILAYVVLAAEDKTRLSLWWFDLVEDEKKFNKYPWGKLSFECTLKILKRDMTDIVEGPKSKYSLHGFPLAIMVWAFEAIPTLGNIFATGHMDVIPRMLAWEINKRVAAAKINLILESKELEVKSTLLPNEAELQMAYWKEFPFCEEEDNTASQHHEGDEHETNANPSDSHDGHAPTVPQYPSPLVDQNIRDLVRDVVGDVVKREMEKIVMRLDRIEYKIDRLSVGDKFRSSAIDRDATKYSADDVSKVPPETRNREEGGLDNLMKKFNDEGLLEENEETTNDKKIEGEQGNENTEHAKNDVTSAMVYERRKRTFGDIVQQRDEVMDAAYMSPMRADDNENEKCEGDGIQHEEITTPVDDVAPFKVGEKENKSDNGAGVQNEEKRMPTCIDHVTPVIVEDAEDNSGNRVHDLTIMCRSPKGRGYRLKRKAPLLESPYIDPTKKRKLCDVGVYDPYREVDPAMLEALDEWDKTTHATDMVKFQYHDVQGKWMKQLLDTDGWLGDEIVDEALYQIRVRASKYPNLFRQDCCIMDSWFCYFVKKAYDEIQKNPKSREPTFDTSALLNYVNGQTPERSRPWKECKYLYFPCCMDNHWVTFEIDLEKRTISRFDSLQGHVYKAVTQEWTKPLQKIIPLLMKMHVMCDEQYSAREFKCVDVKNIPQQSNGADCGILALKYIEFLLAKLDIHAIRIDCVPSWRRKLAAELLAWDFDP